MSLSLAVSVGAQLFSFASQRKARKARKRAAAAQAEVAKVANRQQRRQFIQQFRQSQASAVVSGVASGASLDSSAVQGSLGSNISQARTAVRENDRQQELTKIAGANLNKASTAEGRAALFSTLGSLASSDGISDKINKLGTSIGFPS